MSVLTLIMAGGEGRGLSVLGEERSKPAVPFAGQYRIIDFALSNAVNSELYRIAVLTQYRPHSLMEHIGAGEPWNLNRRRPEGIHIWPAYRGRDSQGWYRGTADALYQNRSLISGSRSDTTLITCGDHIYKQDYRDLLRFHRERRADLTVAVTRVRPDDVHRFGIMSVDADQRVVEFTEKPKQSRSNLASMGVYVFDTDFLLQRLEEDAADISSAHEIGKNMIPAMVERDHVFAYPFNGYWMDMGTITAYWETNLALLADTPPLNLHDPSWMIYTRPRERPPSKCSRHCEIRDSLISYGCVVEGTVVNSVLSPGVRVERGAAVRDSVIMDDTVIRAGAQIHRCILDKQIEVGAGAQVGVGNDAPPNDREPNNLYTGVTLVGKGARVPAGAAVGRNCLVAPGVTPEDFHQLEVPSGTTVSAW
jgi:glucose-1-phosphate adenylyltransferase